MSPLAIIAFLTLGVTAFADHPKFQDLYNALNTPDKLYIVQRSYEEEPTYGQVQQCAYVQRKSLTTTLYNFTKHFIAGNKPAHLDLFGDLIDEKTPNAEPKLLVYKTKESSESKSRLYTLIYWEPSTTCAIFTFRNQEKTECEIYVREQKIKEPLSPSCDAQYVEHCKNRPKHPVPTSC